MISIKANSRWRCRKLYSLGIVGEYADTRHLSSSGKCPINGIASGD
jgi:hypothetical protein